jgi:hypothetical protein
MENKQEELEEKDSRYNLVDRGDYEIKYSISMTDYHRVSDLLNEYDNVVYKWPESSPSIKEKLASLFNIKYII